MKKRIDPDLTCDPMRDSWKPEDKAAEAAANNPLEFSQSPQTKQATVAPPPRSTPAGNSACGPSDA